MVKNSIRTLLLGLSQKAPDHCGESNYYYTEWWKWRKSRHFSFYFAAISRFFALGVALVQPSSEETGFWHPYQQPLPGAQTILRQRRFFAESCIRFVFFLKSRLTDGAKTV
ncbi:MAG: hypothetical protein IJP98_06595 [Clostridia bacterium]|nr:hypothetical protein [Clostridia bacterium]